MPVELNDLVIEFELRNGVPESSSKITPTSNNTVLNVLIFLIFKTLLKP